MPAPHRPRLIATDLDGTFLSPDGSVSDANASAVLRAAELGVPFVFATGRPFTWLSCLDDMSDAHSLVVVSNGAAMYDLAERELSDVHAIPAERVVGLTDRIRDELPGVAFGVEFLAGFGREPAIPSDPNEVFHTVGEMPELVEQGPIIRVMAFSEQLSSEELYARASLIVGSEVELTFSASSDTGFLELIAPGVSKAAALSRLSDNLCIAAADAAAFGDMPNDVEMLDWAGMPYRMSNGHAFLAERGYPIAGSNADSGVGRTVMELLDLPV